MIWSQMLDLFNLTINKTKQFLFENLTVIWKEIYQYSKESAWHFACGIIIYLVLCILFYIIWERKFLRKDGKYFNKVKRILFITAHPDDECMFFGPVIVKLKQKKDCELHLLCLSTGNYYKQGPIRKQELWDSCKILGIPDTNITLCKNTFLPDDPSVRWQDDVVASIVLNHIESYNIDTVVTFDKEGVSKHPNHKSLFCAMAYLCLEHKLPSYCKVYLLESINLLRKYSIILDGPLSFILSSYVYPVNFKEHCIIKSAMKAHKSQLVWYRRIYIDMSRFMYINTFKEMEFSDVLFDFELDD